MLQRLTSLNNSMKRLIINQSSLNTIKSFSTQEVYDNDSSPLLEKTDIFNPTSEHVQLREMLRSFTESEVDPQALEFNKKEEMNIPLFKKLGGE